ncbi:MAG: hypothetical protein WC438_02750 [Candidatus Pacearchaeota archaeon]
MEKQSKLTRILGGIKATGRIAGKIYEEAMECAFPGITAPAKRQIRGYIDYCSRLGEATNENNLATYVAGKIL